MAIISFRNQTTEDIYNGRNTPAARRIPKAVWKTARRKLDAINAAKELRDLQSPPGNHLEALHGDLEGFHSIRVNDQYRIIFRWSDGNASDVQITDYH